jgi:hypothetical protein
MLIAEDWIHIHLNISKTGRTCFQKNSVVMWAYNIL